jgi:hypothetical protein
MAELRPLTVKIEMPKGWGFRWRMAAALIWLAKWLLECDVLVTTECGRKL